jgi:FAD:protein FMN transferase
MTHPAPAAVGAGGEPVDHTFRAMGCDLRIAVVPRTGLVAEAAVARAVELVRAADRALSRFDPRSELCELNADPAPTVHVSRLLALAVDHARRAAASTGGLLDPTLTSELEASGYAADWDPARRPALPALLEAAPPRQAAGRAAEESWRRVAVDREAGTVTRPPGVRLDVGATAKGLVADLALRLLAPADLIIVDLAGDLAIGGDRLAHEPLPVLAADPFDRAPLPLSFRAPGGLATSSIAGRCWLDGDAPRHHLLDPSTGRAAFTGIVQATAAAPSAAEAERLAGQALLAGPAAAPDLLRRYGGVIVHDDGTTSVLVGSLLADGGSHDRT